jgi:PAS domain S-box-containing protein
MESRDKQEVIRLTKANEALQEQIAHLKRAEQTLKTILKGTVAQTGDNFFNSLVQHLAEALEARYAFVGVLSGRNQDHIQTVAAWKEGSSAPNFRYPLGGTPCATVVNQQIQLYPNDTWKLFPEDKPLVERGIECYVGAPLFDSSGNALGLLAVMHNQTLDLPQDWVTILSMFALRAGMELERQRKDETLANSEERYRKLVEQSNEVIFLAYNGRFEFVNERFCQLFAVSPAVIQARQLRLKDIVAPESFPLFQERNLLWQAGKPVPDRFEFIARTQDGRFLPVEISVSYQEYQGGIAVQGILRDQTERKQTEKAERMQRELAEALHEISLALSASLDSQVILDLLLTYLDRVVPYDVAHVIEVQNDQTFIVRSQGHERIGLGLPSNEKRPSLRISQTPTWQKIMATKRQLVIPNVQQSDLWINHPHLPQYGSWAGAPILIGGDVAAFLSIGKREEGFYGDEHGQRLTAFAAQAALALQNARLFTAATQRAETLRITGEIFRALNAVSNIHDAFPHLVNHLKTLTRCQRVSLAELDETRNWINFIIKDNDSTQDRIEFARFATASTAAIDDILNGRPHLVPDISTELHYHSARELYRLGYRSYLSLPLQVNDEVKGGLTLAWTITHGYDASQLPVLGQIADVVALGLERSLLFAKTHARTQELNLLNQVISAANSGLHQHEIMQFVCEEIARHFDVPNVAVLEFDEDLTSGQVAAHFIIPPYEPLNGVIIPMSQYDRLLKSLTRKTQPIPIPDLSQYTFPPPVQHLVVTCPLISGLLVPVSLMGRMVGAIGIGASRPRTFTADEIRLIQTLSDELGRTLETARLYDELREHAAELEMRVAARTQELAQANEQLQELDELKSQFVTDVSHELRTPVTNLKLYLDLLEHKGGKLLPKYLPILQKQADRLGQLIQDILDLSRLEMRRNELDFLPVDLAALLHDVVVAHYPRIEAAGLRLIFQPALDLPPVWGEHNQLAQVVTNLLANAINYTQSGAIHVITGIASNQMAFFEVQDSGIGIHPDDLTYLFNRFYRGQTARETNTPGTGLGLAIAHEIIRLHQGRIEVYSEVGKGSKFRVYLPTQKRPSTKPVAEP